MSLISPLLDAMMQAIRKSSKILIRDFGEVAYLQSSYSGANNFTKSAYNRSVNTIVEELCNYRNDYGVMLESDGATETESEYTWFINPMDSRTNFMSAIGFFATCVALVHNGEVIAAVIDAPMLRETFYAEKGKGAFSEDCQSCHTKMRVNKKQKISMTLIDCVISSSQMDIISKVSSQGVILMSLGSNYLGFAYLAATRYDAVIYSNLHKYKASVGRLLIAESGGKSSYCDNVFIASNQTLYDHLMNL